MFERKKQKLTVPTIETKQVTVPTVAGLKHALAGSAAAASSAASKKAGTAQARGGARLDSVKDATSSRFSGAVDTGSAKLADAKAAAVPMLAAAGAAVAPKLEDARGRVESDVLPRVADTKEHLVEAKDAFVEETLPKIIDAVAGAVAATSIAKSDAVAKARDSEAAHRAVDAAAVLKGDKVATQKKSGGFLSGLMAAMGLLAAAGAIAWFFNKRAAEQDDPWARPLADPYVPPATGRDSTVAAPVDGALPGGDAPATFAPAAGQVSDVPAENTELIPPTDTTVTDGEIKVIDPLAETDKPEGEPHA